MFSSPLFELVLESITEGLIVADQSGKFVLFNAAAEQILGAGPTTGAPVEWATTYPTYLPDSDSLCPAEELPLVRALSGETVRDMHLRIRRPDGSVRDLSCNAHPLVDHQSDKKGGVVIFRDISDEVSIHQKLEETVTALRISNKDLEQFASVAAHDLQEPLRSVSNYLQLFLEAVPTTDETALRYVERISAALKRMQALINALLNYARIESRARPFQPVDCAVVVANCLENLRSSIKDKDAQVTVGELPVVLGDESQIGQLFENLISNAIKFSHEQPVISISAEIKGRLCEFRVRDNGIGIQPRFHERIFLIFQRLHAVGKYDGTGIGLSICKRIVARHGGDIQVESDNDRGSTFIFSLKCAEDSIQ
ncbi:MAG: PAS domain-containing sensor histidine kinase [Cyanobacteria bacterium DS2.3.42]|nr:PAS domain-containing sensor histidine kinase [Cyanobacteria bacterium DS2.3.42]